MTTDRIALRELLEKGSDTNLLREMIGFVADRLMAPEVEGASRRSPLRQCRSASKRRSPVLATRASASCIRLNTCGTSCNLACAAASRPSECGINSSSPLARKTHKASRISGRRRWLHESSPVLSGCEGANQGPAVGHGVDRHARYPDRVGSVTRAPNISGARIGIAHRRRRWGGAGLRPGGCASRSLRRALPRAFDF